MGGVWLEGRRVKIWFLDHVQVQKKGKEQLRKGVYVCIMTLIIFPLSLKWRAPILETWDEAAEKSELEYKMWVLPLLAFNTLTH